MYLKMYKKYGAVLSSLFLAAQSINAQTDSLFLTIDQLFERGVQHSLQLQADVMKESMQIAFSYVQELAQKYGYGYEYFSKHNFHIHCPEGAVPKDGPSAGVALSLCLLSAITGIPVSSDVAMTGEVDLRGRSMPIGGLREKTLAAVREHMRLVLIPKENHNDYLELPDEVKNNVEIKEVESVEDVVKLAFVRMPEEKAVPEQKKEEKASD